MQYVVYVWARMLVDEEAELEEPRVLEPFEKPIDLMIKHLIKRAASMLKIPKEDSREEVCEETAEKLCDLWQKAVDCAIFNQVQKRIEDSWKTLAQTLEHSRRE